MPIKLRPETVEEIRPIIIDFLNSSIVNHGKILDFGPAFKILYNAEELLPKDGPKRQAILDYIGETSILDFMSNSVGLMIEGEKYSEDANPTPLLSVLKCDNVESMADKLLDSFQSLPWTYSATIPLPVAMTDFALKLDPIRDVSPRFRFIHDKAEIERASPPTGFFARQGGLFGLLGMPEQPRACLQFQVDGYVARYGGTETVEEAKRLLRSFLGLALALELFRVGSAPFGSMGRQQIHFRRTAVETEDVSAHSLSDPETALLHKLSYKDSEIEEKIAAMSAIFSDTTKHQSLLRACQWMFSSHVGDDPLTSFVQATVVLEIVLGDKASSNEIGLGTLLANRCAYMIGRTISERAAILKEFKSIYGVRSQIVHSGKHRLTSTEMYYLYRLRWLGRRVIRGEVALAMEEISRDKRAADMNVAAALVEEKSAP